MTFDWDPLENVPDIDKNLGDALSELVMLLQGAADDNWENEQEEQDQGYSADLYRCGELTGRAEAFEEARRYVHDIFGTEF